MRSMRVEIFARLLGRDKVVRRDEGAEQGVVGCRAEGVRGGGQSVGALAVAGGGGAAGEGGGPWVQEQEGE